MNRVMTQIFQPGPVQGQLQHHYKLNSGVKLTLRVKSS